MRLNGNVEVNGN